MRWSKVVLYIQAIMVLIIGIALLNIVVTSENIEKGDLSLFNLQSNSEKIEIQFYNSSYILVLISLIEFVLIWRILK